MGLYDRYLAIRYRRHDGAPPSHVALSLTERDLLETDGYDTLSDVVSWSVNHDIDQLTIAVSVLSEAIIPTLERELSKFDTPRRSSIHTHDEPGDSSAPIQFCIGLGGKREFATAVTKIAQDVASNNLDPDTIDADSIADRLLLPDEPDLFIKTGSERLSDFAIWQSVYTELYFTDVNWRDFRERDFLRALFDYRSRQRRFGR